MLIGVIGGVWFISYGFGATSQDISDVISYALYCVLWLLPVGVFFLVAVLYKPYFIYKYSATIGMSTQNIRIISSTDNKKLEFHNVLLREYLWRIVSILPSFYGYFRYYNSSKRQMWHDVISDTYVVKREINDVGNCDYKKYPIVSIGLTLFALFTITPFVYLYVGALILFVLSSLGLYSG